MLLVAGAACIDLSYGMNEWHLGGFMVTVGW